MDEIAPAVKHREHRVYIAAPLREAQLAKLVAVELRHMGAEVVSTWHDLVGMGQSDPLEDEDRAKCLESDLADMATATEMLVLDHTPMGGRAMYGEAAAFLTWLKRPVIWLCWARRCLWDSHRLSYRVERVAEASDPKELAWYAARVLSARRCA